MILPWRRLERPLVILVGYVVARLADTLVCLAFAIYDHTHNFVALPTGSDGSSPVSGTLRFGTAGDWIVDPAWVIYTLIVTAELAHVRRLWVYAVCGAAAIGITPWLFVLRPNVGGVGSVYDLNSSQYAVAGAVGGLVYWLVTVKWGGYITWSGQQ
jgi:hypothetical protein